MQDGAEADDEQRRGEEQRERRGERTPRTSGDGYQPDTAQISRRSRAASTPAAVRQSSPDSREA